MHIHENTFRSHPGARALRALLAVLLAGAIATPALSLGADPTVTGEPTGAMQSIQEPARDADTFRGRPIADVMSWRGAPWLERDTREEEENPDLLHERLPVEVGALVVDMGCGSGYHARRLARAVGPEGSVLCVDLQPEMLQIAERLAQEEGITNLETVLATPTDPRLPEGAVDLILLVDVYHEIARPAPVLEAMRRSLSPEGVVALVEYRLEGDSAAHIKLEHRMSPDQVFKEWLPAGFELIELFEQLPTQHLFLFRAER